MEVCLELSKELCKGSERGECCKWVLYLTVWMIWSKSILGWLGGIKLIMVSQSGSSEWLQKAIAESKLCEMAENVKTVWGVAMVFAVNMA